MKARAHPRLKLMRALLSPTINILDLRKESDIVRLYEPVAQFIVA